MKVLTWNNFSKGVLKGIGNVSFTIGVFDGMHRGHQKLLNMITSKKDNKSIVLTFSDNPRMFFNNKTYPGNIFTLPQKLNSISLQGVDIVILIDFSYNFSKMSGKDFLYQINDNCDLTYMILGDNFRCGHRGMTTSYDAVKILKAKKVFVDIGEMTSLENQIISSSRIREAVASGDLGKAHKMLGRVFSLDIANIPQISEDKTISIDIKHISQVLPPQGHYSVLTGILDQVQKSEMIIGSSKIIVPLQEKQHLDFIKFT